MAKNEAKYCAGPTEGDSKRQSQSDNRYAGVRLVMPPRRGGSIEPTGGLVATFPVRQVAINAVKVVGTRRPLRTATVNALKASIAQIGLRSPITVRREKGGIILVAGLHRLEAARQLGRKFIPCFVIEGDQRAFLWRIIENLHRAELTVLERAEYIEEIRALLEIRAKEGQVAPPGGQQPGDFGINKTAEALGFTREEIRRAKQVAGLSTEAKAEARKLGLDNNQSALLKIAKLPSSEAQLSALREINERTCQPRVRPAPGVPPIKIDEKPAVGAEATQSQTADNIEAEKSRAVGPAPGGRGEPAPVATTSRTAPTSWDELDIPPYLDRRPLSPEDVASLTALTAAWGAASELRRAWAAASTRVREQFIDTLRRG